jgi:hypothetical protein
MLKLRRAGMLEARHAAPLRIDARHDVLDRTVLARGVHALEDDEQRERLLARLDDAEKSWKFNVADIDERNFWPDYMDAYERCLAATSTARAPWYIVPADDKQNARLIISQVIVEALEKLDMRYPLLDAGEQQKLLSVRAALKA